MRQVLRQEKKYLLNNIDYYMITGTLEKILTPDTHNKGQGYRVRSLYFDTLDDKDYAEKIMGIELRKKIRLRVYNPTDEFAYLEIKQKEGMYQKKRSLKY